MNNDFEHRTINRRGVIAGLDQLEVFIRNGQMNFALLYLEDFRLELKLDAAMEEICEH